MNKETKIRTIVTAILAVNAVLVMFGFRLGEGLTEETVYIVVSAIATIAGWGVGFFKNNDFTEEAAEGTGITRYLKALKKAKLQGVEYNGENFFDNVDEIEGGDQDA